jgi:hypothetical protein
MITSAFCVFYRIRPCGEVGIELYQYGGRQPAIDLRQITARRLE